MTDTRRLTGPQRAALSSLMLFPNGQPATVAKRGHAARPGTGPAGETCKTCNHYRLKRLAKTYRKCGLVNSSNTANGDIRAKDPACSFWEKKDD